MGGERVRHMTHQETSRLDVLEERLERVESDIERLTEATNSNTIAVAEMTAQIKLAARLLVAALTGIPVMLRVVEALAK